MAAGKKSNGEDLAIDRVRNDNRRVAWKPRSSRGLKEVMVIDLRHWDPGMSSRNDNLQGQLWQVKVADQSGKTSTGALGSRAD
uniref:Uncharacterized protein n=1 Tax=Oryza punctata TaxID=4537 RepID=A0A0E0LWS3_ORYPU